MTFDWLAYIADADDELEDGRHTLDEPAGRRYATKHDPLLFALLYLPHHLRDKTSGEITLAEPHLEWSQRAKAWAERQLQPMACRDAEIAPRETGKSTWWFLILPMWAAAHGHRRFAVAFADTSTQAETHLATFRNELENNPQLMLDFPELCAPRRRPRGSTASQRTEMLQQRNGFTFAARGIDSSTLGLKVDSVRPDLIVFDDIEPEESNYSAERAQKRLTTIRDAVLPMNLFAVVVLVGTVTMPGSLVHHLAQVARGEHERDAGVRELTEWVREERIRPHLHLPIAVNDGGSERSIWPEKWPLAYLQSIRGTRLFMVAFENNPLGREGAYWRKDDFEYGDLDAVTRVGLFVDPIVTTTGKSDWCGLAILEWSPTAVRARVRKAWQVRLTGEPLRAELLRTLTEHPDIGRIIVEVNQGGDLWRTTLHDMLVPVELYTVSESKEIRFARALKHYQSRPRRVIHAEQFAICEGQMIAFPRAAYDDVADAVCAGVLYFLEPKVNPAPRRQSYVR